MDRLLRLGGGMPGLNQGPPPSDAPVVDTAEQVSIIHILVLVLCIFVLFVFPSVYFVLIGIHIIFGSLENA